MSLATNYFHGEQRRLTKDALLIVTRLEADNARHVLKPILTNAQITAHLEPLKAALLADLALKQVK